nr:serine protease [Microvirga tunisiensis]
MLTNAHVVDECTTIRVTLDGREPLPARLAASDKANDLALLRVDHRPTKLAAIRIGIRLGEPVAVFGFPLSNVLASTGNFTLGNVTALAGLGDDTRHIQISAPVQPGNSGGPLLDHQGNLVGVVTYKLNALKTYPSERGRGILGAARGNVGSWRSMRTRSTMPFWRCYG